jgi:hypothetical protein
MKNTHNKTKQNRSFRRFVRQLFSSLIKRQNCNCLEEIQKVIEMLREIEDLVEIIARQIARQIKPDGYNRKPVNSENSPVENQDNRNFSTKRKPVRLES